MLLTTRPATYLYDGVAVGLVIACGHSAGLAPLAEVVVATTFPFALVPLSHDGVHPTALALYALVPPLRLHLLRLLVIARITLRHEYAT